MQEILLSAFFAVIAGVVGFYIGGVIALREERKDRDPKNDKK